MHRVVSSPKMYTDVGKNSTQIARLNLITVNYWNVKDDLIDSYLVFPYLRMNHRVSFLMVFFHKMTFFTDELKFETLRITIFF